MSYILEALRKSERERRLGQAPTLPTLAVETPPKRSRPVFWLSMLLLLLTANGIILAFVWRWSHNDSPKSISAVPAAPLPTSNPQPSPSATPANSLERKLQELETRLAKIDQTPSAGGNGTPTPAPASRPEISIPTPEPFRREGKTIANTQTKGKSRREMATSAPEWQNPPFRRSSEPRELDEIDKPSSESLPPAIQGLKINVLAYALVPAERFAVINMSRHVVGDSLPGGIRLVEILPDGLILEMGGERYRIMR